MFLLKEPSYRGLGARGLLDPLGSPTDLWHSPRCAGDGTAQLHVTEVLGGVSGCCPRGC